MEQFNLKEWLKDKSRKVVTRDGRNVRIVCVDTPPYPNERYPITGFIEGILGPFTWQEDGVYDGVYGSTHEYDKYDLFFADEEQPETIEIPFGAKDSELIKDEYFIPEGCTARIEGNKVIIERIKKEKELTEFEKAVAEAYEWAKTTEREDFVNEFATELFNLAMAMARKELQPEFEAELNKAYKCADKVQYENGKKDAIKNIPTWKKASGYKEFDKHVILLERDNRVCLTEYVNDGEYYIVLDDLKTLPKEE